MNHKIHQLSNQLISQLINQSIIQQGWHLTAIQ